MGVRYQHPDYKKLAPKWVKVRDVCAGQDEIHAKGKAYLPALKDQSKAEYDGYVSRATFFNATWRTVAGLEGMVFRKPPVIEVPTAIKEYLDDITMSGVPFNVFAEECTYENLEVERFGILVDYPPKTSPEPPTVAQAEKLGLRPSMKLYKAETIINWKFKLVDNKHTLCLVVLQEPHVETVDEFEQKEGLRYRVLDLDDKGFYRVRVFEASDAGGDKLVEGPTYPLMNGAPMSRIPFYANLDYEEPPLIDLVNLNIRHYQVSADYEHGCHFCGLPTPVVSGYTHPDPNKPTKFYIGSMTAWVFPDPNAKAEFLEFTGQGLEALAKNLETKEQQMAVLGARMLADEKKQVETFGATAIKHTGENSILAAISINVSLKLTKALKTFAEWAGADPKEVKCELNRDFMPVPMNPQMMTALLAALQAGKLSYDTYFENLQRGDVIRPDVTPEQEQAKIDAAPITAPVPAPAAPGQQPPADKPAPAKEGQA